MMAAAGVLRRVGASPTEPRAKSKLAGEEAPRALAAMDRHRQQNQAPRPLGGPAMAEGNSVERLRGGPIIPDGPCIKEKPSVKAGNRRGSPGRAGLAGGNASQEADARTMNSGVVCLVALVSAGIVVGVAATAPAQTVKATTPGKGGSPHETVEWKLDEATITVTYGRPYTKGRKVFGGLHPYGTVWRTGADEATTLVTDATLMFGT